jgi:hypothetical protein
MNANELADELERLYQQDIIDGVADLSMPEAATMLRQQQAEIDALRKSHIELERGIVKDLNQRQSAEPVAWRNLCVGNIGEDSEWIYNEIGQGEPLYTHPAKTEDEGKVCARCGAIAYDPVITQTAKTLTDEEILGAWNEKWIVLGKDEKFIKFARAILTKAQEK